MKTQIVIETSSQSAASELLRLIDSMPVGECRRSEITPGSKVIAYAAILAGVDVREDSAGFRMDESDCWAHSARALRHDGERDSYAAHSCRRRTVIIDPLAPTTDEWYSLRGYSKQAAREAVAAGRRKLTELIKDALNGRIGSYVVAYEDAPAGIFKSCGGVEVRDDANGRGHLAEMRNDIAACAATAYEAAGWLVLGVPDARAAYLARRRVVARASHDGTCGRETYAAHVYRWRHARRHHRKPYAVRAALGICI